MKVSLRNMIVLAGILAASTIFVFAQNDPVYEGKFEKKKAAEEKRYQARIREIDAQAEAKRKAIAAEIKNCRTSECREGLEKEIIEVNDDTRRLRAEELEKHETIQTALEEGRGGEDADYNYKLSAQEEQQRQESLKAGVDYDGSKIPTGGRTPTTGTPGTTPTIPGGTTTTQPPTSPSSGYLRTDVWLGHGDGVRFVRDDGSEWPLTYEVTVRDFVYKTHTKYGAAGGGISNASRKPTDNNPIVSRVLGTRMPPGELSVTGVWVKPFGKLTAQKNEVFVTLSNPVTITLTLSPDSKY